MPRALDALYGHPLACSLLILCSPRGVLKSPAAGAKLPREHRLSGLDQVRCRTSESTEPAPGADPAGPPPPHPWGPGPASWMAKE